jgi:hypothetical protein
VGWIKQDYFEAVKTDLTSLESDIQSIIEKLLGYSGKSRIETIQESYQVFLKKNYSWLLDSLTNQINKNAKSVDPKSPSSTIADINQLLGEIANKPAKKIVIIQEFLDQIAAISPADKKVLLDNFKSLKEAELEQELKNILEIFGL